MQHKYDFDRVINRRGSNSFKWDEAADDVLPMWVADMDFQVAPAIVEALQRRVSHGVFGYTFVPDSYYEATINWFRRRHNWEVKREQITYTTGVVPALTAIIGSCCEKGDKVLVQSPVYNAFFPCIEKNGCVVLDSPLKLDEDYRYQIDFEDFEEKASDERCKMFLLCNPHNPAGRVWTKDELRRLGDICIKHDVCVISDEIHGELTFPGVHYTPYASLGEPYAAHCAVCCSPSKAFNIAGLQVANVICDCPNLRANISRGIAQSEATMINPLAVEALVAAYNEGEQWLEEAMAYMHANCEHVRQFFEERFPQLPMVKMEGTYLPWIDVSHINMTCIDICEYLKQEHKVWVNPGKMYGTNCFFRINAATPRTLLDEGLKRIAAGLQILLDRQA